MSYYIMIIQIIAINRQLTNHGLIRLPPVTIFVVNFSRAR